MDFTLIVEADAWHIKHKSVRVFPSKRVMRDVWRHLDVRKLSVALKCFDCHFPGLRRKFLFVCGSSIQAASLFLPALPASFSGTFPLYERRSCHFEIFTRNYSLSIASSAIRALRRKVLR